MFTLPSLDWKYPFCENAVQNMNRIQPNSNMLLSLMMLIFSILYWLYPFWGIFGTIIQNYLLKVKFGIQTNLKVQNLIRVFTFFQTRKSLFRESLDQKIKVFCLSEFWYLEEHAVLGVDSYICFRLKISFLVKFSHKIRNCFFKLKYGTQTSCNGNAHFSLFKSERPFSANFCPTTKKLSV